MNVVLRWLAQQAILVYLVCLVGSIAYLMSSLSAKRRRDAAQFSLERDINQQRMARSLLVSLLFLMLGGVVFVLSTYLAPMFPDVAESTPVVDVGLFTPTPTSTAVPTAVLVTPLVEGEPLTSTEDIPALELPTATPAPSPTPTAPAVPPPDCPSPNAQLVMPVAGASVSNLVEVRGTAATNAFSYYKFEVQFPGSDTPNFISQYDVPVENGLLGYWDVSDVTAYPPGGFYLFRLVVVDIYGNTAICTIPLSIVASGS
ncbi:MAG: hypothetical protein JW981_03695 [Anaerolineae bacterium]|nr:hypothetical protein [Anaerolineae bacterium]